MSLFVFVLFLSVLAFAETVPLKVIAVESGPASYSSTSVSGVKIYLRSPSTGETLNTATTSTNGVTFNVDLNSSFYVTTAGSSGSALGGTYGFYQELDGNGVPSFIITKYGNVYALCRVSDNSCSYSSTPLLILYKLKSDSSTTPTVIHPACSDSDGGVNIYSKGTATGADSNDKKFTNRDYCSGSTGVMEYSCLAAANGDILQVKYYECPSGYTCDNGACKETTTTKKCSETDGGKNKYTKGTNYIQYANGTNFVPPQSDYCEDTSTVAEFTCSGDQWDMTYESCPSGYTCDNGACVVQTTTPTCTDYDGYNPYTAGSTYSSTSGWGYDICINTNTVREYYCSNGNIFYKDVTCPSGYVCSDNNKMTAGACAQNVISYVNPQGITPYWDINKDPVEFSVGVNNYPDTKDYDQTQNIDGWVNIYKVTPVASGKYAGTLIETKKATSQNGAKFKVYYGEVVDFVGFKSKSAANAADKWMFGTPPYKHFGKSGALCQINYLDTSTVLKMSYNGEPSCAESLSIPYQDVGRFVKPNITIIPVPVIPNITIPIIRISTEMNLTYSVKLQTGWNLISFPIKMSPSPETRVKVSTTTCDAKYAYKYNTQTKEYETWKLKEGEYLPTPDALWVKASAPCKIKVEGSYTNNYDDEFIVPAGWIGIGGPYKAMKWHDIAGNCIAKSGPWRFDTSAWKWKKVDELKPGEGYFVKISNKCTLGGEGLPPFPTE